MSNTVPLYSLDTVRISVQVPVELMLKIKKRAREKGVSISSYATTLLYAATHNDPWTVEDEMERRRIIDENLRKREESKRRAYKAKIGGK